MTAPTRPLPDGFAESFACFDRLVGFLDGEAASALSHAELEERLDRDGRDLLRHLLQDHLDLRASREARLVDVLDAAGGRHGAVEAGHQRVLASMFGPVTVTRLAYRRRGEDNLYPADARLNVPAELHSHGLRRLAAIESARGSFDEASHAITQATGQHVAKRQVEDLTRRAATDVDAFYQTAECSPAGPDDVLVLSADGKGIVMRPEALRPATAAAAVSAKLATRLSKGEKRNRKRLAEVGAVYDIIPVPRRPEDILGDGPTTAPVAKGKWLTASVVDSAATVVASVFDEAERRDPRHQRTWVALVDGNNHQIDRIRAESAARTVKVAIIIDFVHVLEYLWRAAWCFFAEGDPAAEVWVKDKALSVLHGNAATVAASIRRKATCCHLEPGARVNADTCATYLLRKQRYLRYSSALAKGWPIATGIIEGACRHLVKDRMDITGARWGLEGAEAVLKLRAVRSNGDFASYWDYHLAQERTRLHESRYADGVLLRAA
jgi:hypothetical protein